MRKNIGFVVLAFFMFSSCQREPEACFDLDRSGIELGNPIHFSNCSEDGKVYEWDFGDGTTSTLESPTHTYASEGTFLATLTAFSKNEKKSTSAEATIVVGKRYLTEIIVHNVSFTDQNGMAWDQDGTGPDLKMFFGLSENELFDFGTSVVDNVISTTLPFSWIVNTQSVVLTDEPWDFVLFDMDSDSAGAFMSGWQFNPIEDPNNPIWLVGEGNTPYDIEVFWEIR